VAEIYVRPGRGRSRYLETTNCVTTTTFSAGDAADVTFSETRSGLAGPVRVVREPVGVVVVIVPREAPVLAAATKLFAALQMGCPVLLKTAPQTPFSAYLLAQALSDAGLPPGVVSILPWGRDVGAHLISHPQVDAVTFTEAPPLADGSPRCAGIHSNRWAASWAASRPRSSSLGPICCATR
jgi:acyl-CoA reductase-like NAD-dependent aldehyde dehydrogenase